MKYHFIKAGEKVKLKQWDGYTTRGINPWEWLTVKDRSGDNVTVALDDRQFVVNASEIQPPLGYEEIYDIVVNDDIEAKKVLSWLEDRGGVTVWTSHEIGNYKMMYTPGDKSDQKPHYIMGLVEVVTDPKRIRIMLLETSELKKSYKEKNQGWRYDRSMRKWVRLVEWKDVVPVKAKYFGPEDQTHVSDTGVG